MIPGVQPVRIRSAVSSSVLNVTWRPLRVCLGGVLSEGKQTVWACTLRGYHGSFQTEAKTQSTGLFIPISDSTVANLLLYFTYVYIHIFTCICKLLK